MTEQSRIQELRRAVRQVDADAFLVEPRVIRRVVRERYGFARLSTRLPHTESSLVGIREVRTLIHPDELGLESIRTLPARILLVALPEEGDLEQATMQDLLQLIWRRLYHAVLDRELSVLRTGPLNRAAIEEHISRLDQVAFDEAVDVMHAELRLADPADRCEAWCELVAVYQEFKRFQPDVLPVWFPSLVRLPNYDGVLSEDLPADEWFDRTRVYGAPEPSRVSGISCDEAELEKSTQSEWSRDEPLKLSERLHQRLLKRRERAAARENTVKAAVLARQAAECAPNENLRNAALTLADTEIKRLIARLQQALQFTDDEIPVWHECLTALLNHAPHGFWNADKRLLYDLQSVCLDHERTTYKVDLVKWIVSRGKRPLRRPLNNMREVMMAKHLTRSASRLTSVRIPADAREKLTQLLHHAGSLAERQMRNRLRPAVRSTLQNVGLTPGSLPERVAFDKLMEEALDTIAERGYLTMGYLRDAISRNDLKLPDLTHPRELIRGDHLLRSDDQLDLALDGVYRRGEFYLRWLQVISSLFFGTGTGRFLTLFIVIPFGGALILVVGATHMVHAVTAPHRAAAEEADEQTTEDLAAGAAEQGTNTEEDQAGRETADSGDPLTNNGAVIADADNAPIEDTGTGPEDDLSDAGLIESVGEADPPKASGQESQVDVAAIVPQVVLLGFLLMALIHLPDFRRRFFRGLHSVWKAIRTVVYDLPVKLARLPLVQGVWRSRPVVQFRRYLLNPYGFSWLVCRLIPWIFTARSLPWWWVAAIGTLLSIAVNSRLGRDAEELTAEWVANAWYHLRARVVMAFLDWIIDFFKLLLNLLERFIYAVDEWLRFHSGETWFSLIAKALLGVIWSFVSFLLRIYVNLLIEPTLHPLKHFPVVTVAHKMLLPVILVIEHYMRESLTPYFGVYLAGLITWFNIFFLPGIFGFLVWELKENWRLYAANRKPALQPVLVGSHGETIPRFMKPGFHSGTLPKLFRRMRRLEMQQSSFKRFINRRTADESLHHAERDIRRFADRDLVRILLLTEAWKGAQLSCRRVRATGNCIRLELQLPEAPDTEDVVLLFQEQSGWIVAELECSGWIRRLTPARRNTLAHALSGFYRRAGVDLVREQMKAALIGKHPYDVNEPGLTIWPNGLFHSPIQVDLHRRHIARPTPVTEAAGFGLTEQPREDVVFSATELLWSEWETVWQDNDPNTNLRQEPPAAANPPIQAVLPAT